MEIRSKTHGLTRRNFIKWGGLIGLGSLLSWRFVMHGKGSGAPGVSHLSSTQAAILATAFSTLTGERNPEGISDAVAFMDQFLGHLSARDVVELKLALFVLEQSPLLFWGTWRTFTAMNESQRELWLREWQLGAKWRYPLFAGLKELCFMACYRNESKFASIGYDGPLVPVGFDEPAYNAEYDQLEYRP